MDRPMRTATLLSVIVCLGGGLADRVLAVGGSDAPGCYLYSDSIAPLDGNAPSFAFVDISGTGTPLSLFDDQVSGAIPIGFSFSYYGSTYTDLFVSSNGFLTFLSGQSSACCSGQPIPSPGNPNGIVSAFWRDLYPPNGAVYYETQGVTPNRQFILQFQGVPQCCGTSLPATWEIVLSETSNEILIQYVDAETSGNVASAGIENQSGTIGIQW